MNERPEPRLPGANLRTASHDDRTRFYDPDNADTAFIEAEGVVTLGKDE
ncbi:MAG: hypothetical protein ACI8XM_000253 [Haloarculaceae archaeon]|jgi:hypothetical protein